MLGAIPYFNLCPKNDLIITQDNTDNPVTNFKSGVERDLFPVWCQLLFSLLHFPVRNYVIANFISCILLILNFLAGADGNVLPSTIGTKIIDVLLL